jgi:hypothetical protein
MPTTISPDMFIKIQEELKQLDNEPVIIDGIQLKPSQCYHLDTDPAHVLFNTNCPQSLKERIEAILDKYSQSNETGS